MFEAHLPDKQLEDVQKQGRPTQKELAQEKWNTLYVTLWGDDFPTENG